MVNEIRDVKPLVDLPHNIWIFIIFGAVLIGAFLFAHIYYLKRKRSKFVCQEPVEVKTPWEIACEQLDALSRSDYLEKVQYNKYFSELSGIIRQYFEGEFNIRAPEMTTEEFLNFLRNSSELDGVKKNRLKEFLFSCDMVKFAKYTPNIEEAQKCFGSAKDLIGDQ